MAANILATVASTRQHFHLTSARSIITLICSPSPRDAISSFAMTRRDKERDRCRHSPPA
jgi:hypothetical protein